MKQGTDGFRLTWPVIRMGFLFLFLLFQAYFILIRKHDCLDLDIFPNTVVTPALFGGNVVGQSFIAQRDGIARIDVIFTTYQRKNDRDIIFRLFEHAPRRRLLVEKVINAATIPDNVYFSICFPAQKNVRHKKLSFEFLSQSSTLDNCVALWMNAENIYSQGSYHFKRNPEKGDLIFRVYSRHPIVTELGRIVHAHQGFFGSRIALSALIVLLEVVQGLLFLRLFHFIYKSLRPGLG